MKKLIFMNLFVGLLMLSIYIPNKPNKTYKPNTFSELRNQQSAQDFYKKQCGFCHTPEELIAPDMNKIKAKYLEKYPDKDAFIQAVIKFVENPDKNNAIYKEGIENFMDMPKMPFKKEEIKNVAEYIYDNSL